MHTFIRFFVENKLVTGLLLLAVVGFGLVHAPFGWPVPWLPADPVAVDAIPDIGENQQIVFTEWSGRSPQDVDDQVTYPLSTALLGIPGVQTIRSNSMFGFSMVYLIFEDDIDFYWSRSRILEKLNALPPGLLPADAQPMLGPDATALGQVFWYTLEARDENGQPSGGFGLEELRTVQDFTVKYALSSAEGVSEVASIGGFVQEYLVEVDPLALRNYGLSLEQVAAAVRQSNLDVGAQTMEINKVEYYVRGLGYVKSLQDLDEAVVANNDFAPIRLKDVARVSEGPAPRRGVLDKNGQEAVGGVVVARYGSNPLAVIDAVKEKIREISPGLPRKVLADGTVSQVTIVPFYDRTDLIRETIATLEDALLLEILITILVVILMVYQLRASVVISGLLPVSVLMVFIAMRYAGVDANIVALSGIAIAIGTMVDLGIILTENILRRKDESGETPFREVVISATAEVAPAIITAVATTIVSFIPVFALQEAEGKLFQPLAFTKTMALVAALLVTLLFIPAIAHLLMKTSTSSHRWWNRWKRIWWLPLGIFLLWFGWSIGWAVMVFGLLQLVAVLLPDWKLQKPAELIVVLVATSWLLAGWWLPMGVANGSLLNFVFVIMVVGGLLALFRGFMWIYPRLLRWAFHHKKSFLSIPVVLVAIGFIIWQGFDGTFGWLPDKMRQTTIWRWGVHTFPGLGKEFMPSLDEGEFLLMPSTLPHAGIVQSQEYLTLLDRLTLTVPEVEQAVGKLGRVESALDPAPISMYENVIRYKPEYAQDATGRRIRFAVDEQGRFLMRSEDTVTALPDSLRYRVQSSQLIPDSKGRYFRQWRPHIRSADDIWDEIAQVTKVPGLTGASKLQPIETRLVMLQTGMRAPMGIKVSGPDLASIETFSLELEALLRDIPAVRSEVVFAERVVGKPYLQLELQRDALSRYGLSVVAVQQYIEAALGGMVATTTVEGRERYQVRVRLPREYRNDPDAISRLPVSTPTGVQVPLGMLATISFAIGPEMIRRENTFLNAYVLFDRQPGYSEVDAVLQAQSVLTAAIQDNRLVVPEGVSYRFAGNYENQVRADKRLSVIIPLVLGIIFLILYLQFRDVGTSMLVFSGVAVAFSGAFILLWLYGQDWFLNIQLAGIDFRSLFQVSTIHLSVAVWVGFIALFGIATDDGVVMATYLSDQWRNKKPESRQELYDAVMQGAMRRLRPCLMTTATTLLALLPVLTATGKGSDIMLPMALPAFGGMTLALLTLVTTPVLFAWMKERQLKPRS